MSPLYNASNDPTLSIQWHLFRHHVPEAWRYTKGDPSIVVAVLDTGLSTVDTTSPSSLPLHPDSPDVARAKRYSMFDNPTYIVDEPVPSSSGWWFSHGTVTTGVISGKNNNLTGGSGIAPNVTMAFIKTAESDGSIFPDTVAGAIRDAVDRGAKVISISWIVPTSGTMYGDTTPIFQSAVDYAWAHDCVVVAGAGNNAETHNAGEIRNLPADINHVVNVGGLGRAFVKWVPPYGDMQWYADEPMAGASSFDPTEGSFMVRTGYGSGVTVTAAGGDVLTTGYDLKLPTSQAASPTYWPYSGTSLATPIAAAVLALIRSVNPALTAQQSIDILKSTTDVGTWAPDPTDPQHNKFQGGYSYYFPNAGVVNAYKAVLKALTTVPANATTVYPFLNASGDGPLNVLSDGIRWGSKTGSDGVRTRVTNGAVTSVLSGKVLLDLGGYCAAGTATHVELYCGDTLVYSGAPCTLTAYAGTQGTAQPLRVVATNGTQTGDETYTDIAAASLALAPLAPEIGRSSYLKNHLIDFLLRGQSFARPSTLYIALFATSGGSITEVTGGGYARLAVTPSLTVFRATQGGTGPSTGTSGTTANLSVFTFGTPSTDWGSITHIGLYDAATDGNLLVCEPLTTPVTVGAGGPAPYLPVGAMTFRLDG